MPNGLAYPLAVDEETGNLKIVTEADWVKSRIDSLLDTLPLENPMRPRYGTESPIFSSQFDWTTYAFSIVQKLRQEIPEAEFAATSEIADDGSAIIVIAYAYRGIPQDDFILNFLR
ncbi:hypothetical protein IQ273_12920 [Nodosilinea sp. LEGE 07298]|uniref:hypothetical protein n=1 Tax=Nodosilinea sp. LEGE 07298 TaxID=2777970 RepID=UPI001880ACDF|nr:hypothetical protein [Nodosilinea sp. LEGE 07298]MBE9110315.1 hypothetical protein [Nodosilinea sp. LEGE 07298]